jgi:hypothetical protein
VINKESLTGLLGLFRRGKRRPRTIVNMAAICVVAAAGFCLPYSTGAYSSPQEIILFPLTTSAVDIGCVDTRLHCRLNAVRLFHGLFI